MIAMHSHLALTENAADRYDVIVAVHGLNQRGRVCDMTRAQVEAFIPTVDADDVILEVFRHPMAPVSKRRITKVTFGTVEATVDANDFNGNDYGLANGRIVRTCHEGDTMTVVSFVNANLLVAYTFEMPVNIPSAVRVAALQAAVEEAASHTGNGTRAQRATVAGITAAQVEKFNAQDARTESRRRSRLGLPQTCPMGCETFADVDSRCDACR